jgi:hypothetical protein
MHVQVTATWHRTSMIKYPESLWGGIARNGLLTMASRVAQIRKPSLQGNRHCYVGILLAGVRSFHLASNFLAKLYWNIHIRERSHV